MNKSENIQICGLIRGARSFLPMLTGRQRWPRGDFKAKPKGYKRHPQMIGSDPASRVSNSRRDNFQKCMMQECRRGRRLKVKRLLLRGADVDCRDQDGCTPLMLAAQCGHYDTAKLLLDKAANPNARNRNGDAPLAMCAREEGSRRIAGLLLERGAYGNAERDQHQHQTHSLTTEFSDRMKITDDHEGYHDVNIGTASSGLEPGVLLGSGNDVSNPNEDSTQSRQLTPSTFLGDGYPKQEMKVWARTLGSLHMAASEDDTALMQLLVELGADVNGVYREQTPLMTAVTRGAVDLLIRRGADVNAVVVTTSEGERTALLHALSPQYISAVKTRAGPENVFVELESIVRRLAHEGASLTVMDAAGNTPVMAACEIAGAEAVLRFLFGAGVGAQQTNAGGESVLHLATRSNAMENVAIVTHHCRVEVDLGNRMGTTALMIAAMNRNKEIVEHLIGRGASVNKQDDGGNTSLMYAVRSCSSDTEHIRVLLEAGANPNIKNETGFCPLTLAAADLSDQVLCVFLEQQFGLGEDSKEKALGLLLAGSLYTPKVRTCAMTLLEHNTRSSNVNPSAIHKFIADGHTELVERLIGNGTPPSDAQRDDPMVLGYCWPVASASPLCAALLANQPGLARRIAELWFLTPSDFKLAGDGRLKEYLLMNNYTECLDLLKSAADHAISLRVSSFTAVSAAVGYGAHREERVKRLHVPEIIKDMLLFKSPKQPQGNTATNFVKTSLTVD